MEIYIAEIAVAIIITVIVAIILKIKKIKKVEIICGILIAILILTLIGTYTVNQTINIVDTTAPEITLKGDEKYNQSYAKEYVEPGYTVTDNYDENLADKVQANKEEISKNEYNLIYTVVDNSGNKASKTRKVCIVDDI